MDLTSTARSRALPAVAGVTALAILIGGCGGATNRRAAGNVAPKIGVASSNNDGVYVDAGPITYQLQVSRQLNPYATEDSQYLVGVPGARSLRPDELWYGVFLWAKNQQKVPESTTGNFLIEDTQGNRYYPLAINHSVNPYVWTSQQLAPGGIQPGPDTTASFGPTQGELLLFKLTSAVYDNRPLTLKILGPARQLWGTISLDL